MISPSVNVAMVVMMIRNIRVTKVLKQRVITAVLLLVALIAATTQLSAFYFSLFVAAVILVAAWEWAGLVSPDKEIAKLPYLGSIAAMLVGSFFLLGISPEVQNIDGFRASLVLMLGLLFWLISLFFLAGYPENSNLWNDESKIALMGVLVLIPAFVGIVVLKYLLPSGYLVLALVILVAAVDVGAYFVGVNFGSRKLAAKLSPKKSWEGVWGGTVVCLLVAALFVWLMHNNLQSLSSIQITALLTLSVGVTFFSVVGDLIESMLKRNCDVKDSGTMLPGHGGVLDRVDGLVAATPLFVLTMMLVLDSEIQVSL
ncbi:MAG: phosphatidate cytidylyltransferase [SAR86 cluster bacterium]|uniref:Phosphatidate cytidylyltransferase n=1 Tax=SAR86 cluster bacterium TaxID=2030880 RepID=A0A2A4XBU5_9GAMM|nr:MAG: phosphatidate cytidylyltransferase [SAR86 cluster bacterium]